MNPVGTVVCASGKGDGELAARWKSIAHNERAISYDGFLQRE